MARKQRDVLDRATAYWRRKRGERPMPARTEIDPAELAGLLPHIVVAEAVDGGEDYVHRIAGEAAESLLGAEIHGARLSGLDADQPGLANWRRSLDLARQSGQPRFATLRRSADGRPVRVVCLPLSRRPGQTKADFVLSAISEAERTNGR